MPNVRKKFPEGFYWGELVRGTSARPFELKYEFSKYFSQKVYSFCKKRNLILRKGLSSIFYEKVS